MRIFIVALLFLIVSSFNNVGSNTAYLSCKTESGRTLFYAELQDIIGSLEKAELKVDDKKLVFNDEDEAFTIFDPRKNVFTIYITGKNNKEFPNGRFIQFWALPETFKIISSYRSNQKYEFKARIEATEPRKDKDLQIPQVELTCILTYKI